MVPHLERACVEYLQTNIDASNACLLLSQSNMLDEPELAKRCLDVIDSQAQGALQSHSFIDIDYQTLQQILGRDTLCVDETVVFVAATRWAKAECTRQGRDNSPHECRGVLGDAMFLLRFPIMTPRDFANGAGKSGLLRKQEIIDIFFYFTADSKPELRFPTTRRKPPIITCLRFNSAEGKWSYQGQCDRIQFSVDKDISVAGFGLYGSCQGAAKYDIDIALKQSGTVLCQKKTSMYSDGSRKTVHVLFDHACRIEANMYYTATLTVLKPVAHGHSGRSGICQVKCDDTNFTFKNSPGGSTTVEQGQIPEILFYCWHDTFLKGH